MQILDEEINESETRTKLEADFQPKEEEQRRKISREEKKTSTTFTQLQKNLTKTHNKVI